MLNSGKYDHYLLRRLREMERQGATSAANLHVTVQYSGDVTALQRAGLQMTGNAGGVAIGNIAVSDLGRLEQLDNVTYISTEPPIRLHLDTSLSEIHADLVQKGDPAYTGAGVIIGVIDSGIDVHHKNFRRPDGPTRIISIWDQTIAATGAQRPPAGFPNGVEFSTADIQNAVDHPDQAFAHVDTVGHGTHVAGIAAGNGSQSGNCHSAGRYIGVATEASLIIVKVLSDSSQAHLPQVSVNDAATYIFQKANSLVAALPAVINMSIQWGLSARDGTSLEEIYLDALLGSSSGRAIVVAAGNSGDLGTADDVAKGLYNAGFHSAKHIPANSPVTVTIMVPPDDKKSDVIEIWYSAGAGRLSVSVVGPRNVVNTGPVAAGPGHNAFPTAANPLVEIDSSVNVVPNNKGRITIVLDPPAGGSIASGPWVVTLRETAGTAVDANLWIFNSSGDPHCVFAFADRTNATTLTAPGTAKNVITVGAYASKTGDLADFSSRGPTLAADNRQKPDICAPGLEEAKKSGIISTKAKSDGGCCCDCCYDFYVDMEGTSMAAPHVSGVVAMMLERNKMLTFEQIRATIQKFSRPPAGVALPSNDWGFGKLDAQLAIANIPPSSAFSPSPVPAVADSGSPGPGGIAGLSTAPSSGSPPDTIVQRSSAKRFPALESIFPRPSVRIATALRDAAMKGKDHPAAQIVIGLVSMHFDEVFRLVNRNRRVATKWHRMYGPDVLRHVLWANKVDGELIPATIRNQDVGSRLRDLVTVLMRFGSARLNNDLQRYAALLLNLPGAVFSGLPLPPTSEADLGRTRNA